jgi:hypothetical protein
MDSLDDGDPLLARKRALNAREAASPELSGRLRELRHWQATRLARTYEDLREDPRYQRAVDFFLTDLYGPQDFTWRDQLIDRAWDRLKRTLPRGVLGVLGDTVELQALTAELDHAMVAELAADALTAESYAAAYRAVGRPAARKRQIELIVGIGARLDQAVAHRLTGLALIAARVPAYAAGFGVLQSFLERGYSAFRSMKGAARLLESIRDRETSLMEALLRGDPQAFGACVRDSAHG